MKLNNLSSIREIKNKRVGRGIGSGRGGHTSGRGNKGQKSKGKIKLGFEGTKTKKSFIKRLPMLRGKGKFKPWSVSPVIIKTGDLADWPEKETVNIANLIKRGFVPEGTTRVKILADGKTDEKLSAKKFKIEVESSSVAKKMISE